MLAACRARFSRLAARWSELQDAEEKRFQESFGIEPDADDMESEPEPAPPCNVEESAPNLADIVRSRLPADEPTDFMYRPERGSSDED